MASFTRPCQSCTKTWGDGNGAGSKSDEKEQDDTPRRIIKLGRRGSFIHTNTLYSSDYLWWMSMCIKPPAPVVFQFPSALLVPPSPLAPERESARSCCRGLADEARLETWKGPKRTILLLHSSSLSLAPQAEWLLADE